MRHLERRAATATAQTLLPFATNWAEAQERRILSEGEPLSASDQALAARAGVLQPEQIRVLRVPQIPTPEHPVLRAAARAARFSLTGADGMALGYGIYLCTHIDPASSDGRFTLAHEMGHVAQYEQLGGIAPFLVRFLTEILTEGYLASPLEIDADARAARALRLV